MGRHTAAGPEESKEVAQEEKDAQPSSVKGPKVDCIQLPRVGMKQPQSLCFSSMNAGILRMRANPRL